MEQLHDKDGDRGGEEWGSWQSAIGGSCGTVAQHGSGEVLT